MPLPPLTSSLFPAKLFTKCEAQLPFTMAGSALSKFTKAAQKVQGAQQVTWEAGLGTTMLSLKRPTSGALLGLLGFEDCFLGFGLLPLKTLK